MATVLTDLSREALAAAAEENLLDLLRAFGKLPGAELVDRPELVRVSTGLASPMFNAVGRARLDPGEVDAEIEGVKASFAKRGALAFWWVGERSTPSDLGQRLLDRGLVAFDPYWAAMALDLERVGVRRPETTGVTVTRVRDGDGMRVWAETFCAAYDFPAFAGESWVEATEAAGYDSSPWSLYVARLDGKPAGVSLAFPGSGVVGLLGIATIPEARRRGVGAAVTVAPMIAARAQGFRAAVLYSTEMGQPLYRSLGFEELGSGIARYLWAP